MSEDRLRANQQREDKPWPDVRARPRTFFSTPLCAGINELEADIAFIGMPFDQGTFGRPGVRYRPDGLRDTRTYAYTSWQDGREAAGYFDSDQGKELLRGVTMADCGNITVVLLSIPGLGECSFRGY